MGCSMLRWVVFFVLSVQAAAAAQLDVQLHDRHGQPVADAVISVTIQSASSDETRTPAQTKVIDQKNEQFDPYLEIFRPGDSVIFRNSDSTRHHVYSFSPSKTFEFVLASGEQSPPIILDKPGVIATGCNIHDSMITYLVVSDARWLGRSGKDGVVTIKDIPAGSYQLAVWHPLLRPGSEPQPQALTIDPVVTAVSASFALSLLPDPRATNDLEHAVY